ncbi:hypothetical protein SLS62_009921 [Diatrype stigma]|uniref:Uncharacterized protein n=1 Tax=Diatrype stigma TaxID=117547 RepID=A0AAN9UEH5_9PEZI
MATRPLWLKCRQSKAQRAHFALFVPHESDAHKDPNDRAAACRGTVIHAVGAPMSGGPHRLRVRGEGFIRDCGSDSDAESGPEGGGCSFNHRATGILDGEALKSAGRERARTSWRL